ncbi:MAG: aminotransferase class I/II-fold pyridoxal phosphate-dependent enzyme [Guyparkeria sp.]
MIPLAVPNLTGREAEYLQECVTSTFVSSVGPFVSRLERDVSAAAGAAGAVAVNSGTAGLHLALRTVGVGPGDLVAMPSFTFVASANAVSYCGAQPWLFDGTETSWTIDAEQLASTLKRRLTAGPDGAIDRISGRRLAAVMPVHALGHPADMAPLVELAAAYDVPVVADAAAALGADYRGRPIGQTGAALSVLSFNGNKTVTAGGGGAVVSSDESLLERARHLSATARRGPGYDHDEVGFNYRLTNVQAAVGCAQVEQLDRFVATKRQIHDFYRDHLDDLPGVRSFPIAQWAQSACWFSGVVLDGHDPNEVDRLRDNLRERGVDARPFWKPMHRQRPYSSAMCEPQNVTDQVWPRIVPLPCSTGITDEELRLVVTAVRESFS